jgi:hypothetical protein
MKTRNSVFCVLIVLLLCRGGGVFPQNAEDLVFAPFVSLLSVEVKNNLIRLSWSDSPDARGPVFIYRSSRPFSDSTVFLSFTPVEVPYGAQSYIDEPEINGASIYYFVAASDETGNRFTILLPGGNTIMVSPSVSQNSSFSTDGFDDHTLKPVESGIFGLETRLREDAVIITYRQIDPSRNAVLYRSVQPIKQISDLLGAVIVQSGVKSPFTDYPVPGIPYYYGVILEEELTRGSVGIFPGHNTSAAAVEIPAEKNLPVIEGEMRSVPLPLISFGVTADGLEGVTEFRNDLPMKMETARAVSDIKALNSRGAPDKKPRAFLQDLEIPAGGEESALRSIAQGSFAKRDWLLSRTDLLRYLSLPRSAENKARARFYLGQTYYFTNNYREALMEFLLVQSLHPREANEWIEAVLAKMAERLP